ncbi:MAG: PadR family transcriptional regulator [Gemmatimonadetes bacterium]|nr:PadR family transcriptional regulator [Gemmatimonadota bacterium]
MRGQPLEVLQGTLDTLMLKALSWGPRHGYGVASWIRETTTDELSIEDGALYTALHRMEQRGWLAATWGVSEHNRKAKYYELTELGRRELKDARARWTRYAGAVSAVLEARA